MLVELRGRSQLTIPSEIIKAIGACEGDKFEVVQKDGGIFLCPVVVYPKSKMEQLAKIAKEASENKANMKTYDDVSDMFADMGIDIDNV